MKVLFRSDTQYTGLDYGTLILMAEGMDIPVDQTLFENLGIFEGAGLKYLNGYMDKDTCNTGQKEKCRLEFGEEWLEWACRNCMKYAGNGCDRPLQQQIINGK